MSRLFIVTQPEIVSGFHLAGVDAFAAKDAGEAQAQIEKWLMAGERGLLAVDAELFAGLTTALQKQLEGNDRLPLVILPSGRPVGSDLTSREHIARLIREAIGFHITFQDR